MNSKTIVAGATGNLGGSIVKSLVALGAEVVAIVRKEAGGDKTDALNKAGAKVIRMDFSDPKALATSFEGASCVVSALAGLRDVFMDAQTSLLEAAVAAGVPRFIPSDFCKDYTELLTGSNRNFDLRKEFRLLLDTAPVQATSILNEAFAEVLRYNMPFLDRKKSTVGLVENVDHQVEFAKMDNTAAFTAASALDTDSPRYQRIASFQVGAKQMAAWLQKFMVCHLNYSLWAHCMDWLKRISRTALLIRQGNSNYIRAGSKASTCTVCSALPQQYWIMTDIPI